MQENFPLNESAEINDLHLNPASFKNLLKRIFSQVYHDFLRKAWEITKLFGLRPELSRKAWKLKRKTSDFRRNSRKTCTISPKKLPSEHFW